MPRSCRQGRWILAVCAWLISASSFPTGTAAEDESWFDLPPTDAIRWTASADTMILHRSSADSAPILWQNYLGADPGPVVFNARDFQFDLAAGPDLRLIRHGDNCDVEVRYFQIDGWSASRQLEGTFGMAIDTFGRATGTMDPLLTYGSRLHNVEVNLRRPANEWLTVVAGFRWLRLDETYVADQISPFAFMFNNDIVRVVGSYQTVNNLYGFQVGGDAMLFERPRWRLDGFLRAGIFANDANQQMGWASENNYFGPPYGVSGGNTLPAFVGETGLKLSYRLTANVSLQAGYQVMWLEGVGLAPNQFANTDFGVFPPNNTPVTRVDSGGIFYHGASFGMTVSW